MTTNFQKFAEQIILDNEPTLDKEAINVLDLALFLFKRGESRQLTDREAAILVWAGMSASNVQDPNLDFTYGESDTNRFFVRVLGGYANLYLKGNHKVEIVRFTEQQIKQALSHLNAVKCSDCINFIPGNTKYSVVWNVGHGWEALQLCDQCLESMSDVDEDFVHVDQAVAVKRAAELNSHF